jgi:hypothetical protein
MRTKAIRALLGALLMTMLAASAAQASGPPIGKRLSCYDTYSDSGSKTGYNSNFVAALTLRRSGPIRYQVSVLFDLNERADHVSWTYKHGTIAFRHGFFGHGGGGLNVVGRYVPGGVKMANAQLTAAKYTVVLRSNGTPINDTAPPQKEGTDFRKSSWWYCTTGKPVYQSHGSSTPGTTTTPTTTTTTTTGPTAPAGTGASSGVHPPYGTYLCTDKSGESTGAFTLRDPFSYVDVSSGTFTYTAASGRMDFHDGAFDDNLGGMQLYGLFQGPSTIVLVSRTATPALGPDADENGAAVGGVGARLGRQLLLAGQPDTLARLARAQAQ